MINVALFIAYTISTFSFADGIERKIYGDQHKDYPNTHKDLERISKYEIIQVDTTSFESSNIIEFDAFEQHYKIELRVNNYIHPGLIRHKNGIFTKNGKQFYTNLNKSCHYHGRVLNTNESSMIALSLCDKRGIRGSITAFGDTIIIKPANYYLDLEYDRNKYYDITDKHLVYLQSEFDTTGFPMDEGIETNIKRTINNNNNNKKRRRLAYNSGTNNVELYVMADPTLTNTWKNDKGYSDDEWYEQMVSYLQDMVNRVSAEFEDTNWGNQIGDIIISLVEIEVAFDFNGIYASLEPDIHKDASCYNYYNQDCEVDGSGYLGKFKAWIGKYKNVTTFDAAQLWSSMNFYQAGGWGYVGTICYGKSASSNIAAIYTDDWSVRSAAHELGHNFNMYHDSQAKTPAVDCGINDGLMGYGSAYHGFSDCSVSSLKTYFNDEYNQGLTCLGDDVRSLTSNYGNVDNSNTVTPKPTPKPTTKPPTEPEATPEPTTPSPTTDSSSSSGDWTCVGTSGLEVYKDVDLNKYWQKLSNLQDGKVAYSSGGYYLYFSTVYNMYLISTTLGSTSVNGYCIKPEIQDCDGLFTISNGDGGWKSQSSGGVFDCADKTNTNDDSDTDTDTDSNNNNNDGNNDPGCPFYDCISIYGEINDKYDYQYDGQWKPAGCVNNVAYYQKDGMDDRYLCYSSDYNLWIISNSACGKTAYAYSTNAFKEDIVETSNTWYVLANSWEARGDVVVYDCAGNAGFGDDTSCLDNNQYQDSLCLYNGNQTLFDDGLSKQFDISSSCLNDKPVYHHIVYNKSLIIIDSFGNSDYEKDAIYYLHYNLYKKFSNDIDYSGQWIISVDEITTDGDAICNQENLLDCIQGEWEIENVGDDLIEFITDFTMNIQNQECKSDENNTNNENKNYSTIIIIILIIVALIMIICGYYLYKRSSRKTAEMVKKMATNAVTEMTDGGLAASDGITIGGIIVDTTTAIDRKTTPPSQPEEEIEIEVSVEKKQQHITQTCD